MSSLLLGALILAASSQPLAPQELLAGMRQALGGEEAMARRQSLSVRAACSGPGGEFQTELLSLPGERVWFRQTSDDGTTEIWSTPERTWSRDADGEIQELSAGVRSFVRAHEFHLELFEVERRFRDLRADAPATIRDEDCDTIRMLDQEDQPAVLYLSRRSHLPVMLERNAEGAAGPIRIYFEDWQSIDGLLYFHAFNLSEGDERQFRYDYESIEVNPELDDARKDF